MTKTEAIDYLTSALNVIADKLNCALVGELGDDADWENDAGSSAPHPNLGKQPQRVLDVWATREEANSAIAWVELHLEEADEPTAPALNSGL